jgi:uncharacterized membrane protein YqaE (UPF0057 family)
MTCGDLFLALIAVLFPPIAGASRLYIAAWRRAGNQIANSSTVWIKVGLCTADSFINIALCCLGYVPGLIHAWYIIARNPDPMDEYEPIHDSERADARVTYYYISHEQPQHYGSSNTPANKPVAGGRPAPPPPSAPAAGTSAAGPSSGEETAPPPSYSETVKGDHKVQTQD